MLCLLDVSGTETIPAQTLRIPFGGGADRMTEFLLQISTDADADEPKLREKAKSIGTGAYLSTPTALRRRRSAADDRVCLTKCRQRALFDDR